MTSDRRSPRAAADRIYPLPKFPQPEPPKDPPPVAPPREEKEYGFPPPLKIRRPKPKKK
jgi:hypothetical protein